MKVLHVEDDSATAQSVELMLKSEGFNVFTTDLGEEGADLAKTYDYDCLLLDINLPDMSGLDVLRTLRAAKIRTPVMMVTGSSLIDTKLKAFRLGADDYLTKPFHKDELVERIRAVVRRSKGHAESAITCGPIEVSLDAKTVRVAGKPVHFTGKEYQMMELMALRRGQTLTKEMFLNHLYGGMDEPELKIIDVFICKLRKKLAEAGAAGFVDTVWGRGYVLRENPAPALPETIRAGRVASSFQGDLLIRLSEGDANFDQLRDVRRDLPATTLSAALGSLRQRALIRSYGSRPRVTYALTEAGRARLAKHAKAAA